MYVIKNSVSVFEDNNNIILNDTINNKVYRILGLDSESKNIIYSLLNNKKENLSSYENNKKYDKVLSILKSKDMIIENYDNNYIETMYEKQVDFFSDFLDNPNTIPNMLNNKKVVIIGLGGVGCIAIQHLLSCGVSKFILIDPDYVSESNLNRQFCYTQKQVGKSKVDAMKNYIKSTGINISASYFKKFVDSETSLEDMLINEGKIDFILVCADTPAVKIRNYILNYAIKQNIPLSFVGIGVYDGFWGPLIDSTRNMKNFYNYNEQILNSEFNNLKGIVSSSIGFTNSIISSYFVKDIIMYLSGVKDIPSKNKLLQLNFKTNKTSEILDISKEI